MTADAHPPGADDDGPVGRTERPAPDVRQDVLATGRTQQANLGAGNQFVYFGDRERAAEAAISIAAPFGQRDANLPLRGREKLLADLRDASVRVHVLHGLGGCGKTRLALEAAFDARRRGAEVWWISAAQRSTLESGMRALGRRLGVTDADLEHGDSADVIWRRLETWPDPWLLVIDNADDPPVLAGAGTRVADGRGWLRPATAPTQMILVTSRDGSTASWASWCARHRLGTLPAEEAAAMLADHAEHAGHTERVENADHGDGIGHTATDHARLAEDDSHADRAEPAVGQHSALGSEDAARALAQRLGGLPLALKIAGSYLAKASAVPAAFAEADAIRTYRQYINVIERGDLDTVFAPDGSDLTQERARELIGRTWELSLDLLQTRNLPEARRVLRLLATFADAPIPYQLLLRPAVLAANPLFDHLTGPRLWQLLESLDDFGLIDLSSDASPNAIPTARLHPLVRDTSHTSTDQSELLTYLELASQLLEQAAGSAETGLPEDPPTWPMWQLLAPHATHVLADVASTPGCPDEAIEAAAHAAHLAARYPAAQGLHAHAEAQFRNVLTARLRVLSPDHPSTLTTRYCIALEMAERGDHAAAEAEYRDVLTAKLRVLGPDHPNTLTTRHQIATEIAERGDHAAAEAEFRDVLAAKLRVLGPTHPDTLVTSSWIDHLGQRRS
jgi:hypothetical protein